VLSFPQLEHDRAIVRRSIAHRRQVVVKGATPLVTVTSPTCIDTGVTTGQTYHYKFTALNGTAESARTSEFSATAK
jgi:hypothetical protein